MYTHMHVMCVRVYIYEERERQRESKRFSILIQYHVYEVQYILIDHGIRSFHFIRN